MRNYLDGVAVVTAAVWLGFAPPTSAAAPVQQAKQEPPPLVTVGVDDLEDRAGDYLNRRIRVYAEVEDVLGPRLFKIDEPNWADLGGEVLVFMDTTLIAMLQEDDRVTITGTLRPFTDVRLEREWGWLAPEPEIEARIRQRPVLVATHVVSQGDGMSMTLSTPTTAGATTGTSGRDGATAAAKAPITDVAALAAAKDGSLVGRDVKLESVRVAKVEHGGFWIRSGGERLYVLPMTPGAGVKEGDRVSVDGSVLRMPKHMSYRLETKGGKDQLAEQIYVYAISVS